MNLPRQLVFLSAIGRWMIRGDAMPQLDYLGQVKPMEDAGVDDATIAMHWDNATAAPLPCDQAKVILESSGLVREDPITRVRSGTLVDHYNTLPEGQDNASLGHFISHVFGRGVDVSIDEYPYSVSFASVLAGLSIEMDAAVAQLIALGGGRPYEGTVEQDVIDSRDAHAEAVAEQARKDGIYILQAEIENTWINPAILDPTKTAEQLRSEIKADL